MRADEAITGLLHRYAECVDSADFDGVSALFEGATYRTEGVAGVLSGDEVGSTMHRTVRLYDGRPQTMHLITNTIVEVDPADPAERAGGADRRVETAAARSYFTVVQDPPGHPPTIIITGRYHDRFARHDGVWRFTDRLIHLDQVGDLSGHLHLDRLDW